MKYVCAVDPAAFDTFLDARLAEHNERERNPAYRYERVPADAGLTAVRIYRGRDYDLIAVIETSVEDGFLTLDVQMEDIPACVSRRVPAAENATADAEAGTAADRTADTTTGTAEVGESASLAARVAAHLTKLLVISVFLWGSVWGISYLLGNRNPWLPLIAPAGYLLLFAVTRCIQYRPRDAKGDFSAFLEHDLAATPCLAEAEEDPGAPGEPDDDGGDNDATDATDDADNTDTVTDAVDGTAVTTAAADNTDGEGTAETGDPSEA